MGLLEGCRSICWDNNMILRQNICLKIIEILRYKTYWFKITQKILKLNQTGNNIMYSYRCQFQLLLLHISYHLL